jgi:hypothetical protein
MPVSIIPRLALGNLPTHSQGILPSSSGINSFPALLWAAQNESLGIHIRMLTLLNAHGNYPRLREPVAGDHNSDQAYRSRLTANSCADILRKDNARTKDSTETYLAVRTFLRFLDLPFELRDRIYELAIESHTAHQATCLRGFSYNIWSHCVPPVCRAIPEATPAWIRSRVFVLQYNSSCSPKYHCFSEVKRFTNVMSRIERGWESVPALDLPRFDHFTGIGSGDRHFPEWYDSNPYVDLMKRCSALRTVRLSSFIHHPRPNSNFAVVTRYG